MSEADPAVTARRLPWLPLLVVGATVAALVAGVPLAISAYEKSRAVSTGECVSEYDEPPVTYVPGRRGRLSGDRWYGPDRVDCSSAEAAHVVLGERPAEGRGEDCADVAGAESAVRTTRPELRYLCLGPVGVDPVRALNTVAVGDCVVVDDEDAHRAGCTEPGALRVLEMLEDLPRASVMLHGVGGLCADTGSQNLFTWRQPEMRSSVVLTERGLCLGPVSGLPRR